jgi:hypothetical protein
MTDVRARIPDRYATVEPDGDDACLVTTKGPWSPSFLVWMATLDAPLQVLSPDELVSLADMLAGRLAAAVPR